MKAPKAPKPFNPVDGEKYELPSNGNCHVKLYRRERTTVKGEVRCVYEVVDHTNGTRKLHGFSKLDKARRKAQQIADALAVGENLAAGIRSADAMSYGRATELLRPTGASLELAAAVYAKCFAIFGGDRLVEACTYFKAHGADAVVPRMVPTVVAELLAAKQARGKSQRYIDDLRARLNRFADVFRNDIASVTTADVTAFLDGLKVAPATAKAYRAKLYSLFRFAESHAYIPKAGNPVADVERIETNGDGEIEIYSPDEITKLLAAASKDFRPVVAIGAFAGVRTAELLRLEWRDIDLAGGFITVGASKAKTRSRRLVPIADNLKQWLAPYARRRGRVWCHDSHDLDDARVACAEKAGVAWKHNALRHSYISYRLAETQDASKVSLEAGNSPRMVFRHYRELVKPTGAVKWFAVSPEQPENIVTMPAEKAAI